MQSNKLKALFSFTIMALITVGLISCGGNSAGSSPDNNNNNGDNGGNNPSSVEVEMVGQSFSSSNIEVEVGTTVTWTNESSLIHTVTSGSNGNADGTFDSGNVSPGETFSYTFDEVGTFDYFCEPHISSGMVGTVTVIDSNGNSSGY